MSDAPHCRLKVCLPTKALYLVYSALDIYYGLPWEKGNLLLGGKETVLCPWKRVCERLAGGDEVVEHFVDEGFVPDADVAVRHEVILQGAQFQAQAVWRVSDGDLGKIGQARERTDRREFVGGGGDFHAGAGGGIGIFVVKAFQDGRVDSLGPLEGDRAVEGFELFSSGRLILQSRYTSRSQFPERPRL